MLRISSISHYILILLLFIILFSLTFCSPSLASTDEKITWYEQNHEDGQPIIHLYFFWSKNCPHCVEAAPAISALDQQFPWLKLHSLELIDHPHNAVTYQRMASLLGVDALSVPAFMFCGNITTGYDNENTTGEWLKSTLQACYQFASETKPSNTNAFDWSQQDNAAIDLPLLGRLSTTDYSLPLLTILIAGMDSFNPCAFFVLLFLLSMMVHGRSRAKMALIGSIFVFFSALIYFLFMSAWLNLFIYLGELRVMTYIAGSIALVIATLNIRDYFQFKRKTSLSIEDSNKSALLGRMRRLLNMDSTFTVVMATIVLAIVANSYELLCTAGFPMVYTRILTLNTFSSESYYLYLLLYNLVYIIPLLIIVIIFTIKLGSRKLSEREGRILKLLSGNMMLLLGLLLVIAPQLLNNLVLSLLLVSSAAAMTWGIIKFSPR